MLQYKGDLQPGYFPNKPAAAAELIGRYNLSMAAVVRANLLVAPNVRTSSAFSSDPYISGYLPTNGSSFFLGELGVFGEYNFFNYRNPKNRFVFGSPYLFGGPAVGLTPRGEVDNFILDTVMITASRDSIIKPKPSSIVPFFSFVLGVGYKQQLGKYFNLGIQFSGRFLFSDNFDAVSDREIVYRNVKDENGNLVLNPDNQTYQYIKGTGSQIGNKSSWDSYYFLGFSLTYTIKEVICPFKYEKKTEKS